MEIMNNKVKQRYINLGKEGYACVGYACVVCVVSCVGQSVSNQGVSIRLRVYGYACVCVSVSVCW